MKIVFNRKMLCNAFPPLLCAVSSRATISAAEGVLIEAGENGSCRLTTYDTDKGIRLSVEAKVYSSGSCIIDAQKFLQVIRAMEGDEVELSVDDRYVAKISSGRSNYRMSALPAKDFPSVPEIMRDRGFVLPQATLKKIINQVSHSMGVEDTRPILNGAYFIVEDEQLTVVSCDSFKLAKRIKKINIENKNASGNPLAHKFIVPVKTINELVKLLEDDEEKNVTIFVTRKYIVFLIEDITFFSRLIDGEYIDYNRIIIKDHKIVIKTDKASFLGALERAALITEERVAGSVRSHVRLELDGEMLKITATSAKGSTYDEIAVEHEGDNLVIGFNNRYLIDSLRACDADDIKISMSTPLTSINIEPLEEMEDGEEIFMLLPLRMKE